MTVRHVVRGGETRGTVTPTHGHGARNSLVITGRDALLRKRDAALAVPTGPDVLTFVCEKKKYRLVQANLGNLFRLPFNAKI